jgi:hypothetical protein
MHTHNRSCYLPAPLLSIYVQFYPVLIYVSSLLFWILKRINNSPCDVNSTLHSLQTIPCYNSWQLHFSLEGGQPSRMAKQVSSDVMLVPVRLPSLQAAFFSCQFVFTQDTPLRSCKKGGSVSCCVQTVMGNWHECIERFYADMVSADTPYYAQNPAFNALTSGSDIIYAYQTFSPNSVLVLSYLCLRRLRWSGG